MRWAILASLIAIVLAGCTSGDGTLPDPQTSSVDDGDGDTTGTGEGGNGTDDGTAPPPGNGTGQEGTGNETVEGNGTSTGGNGTAPDNDTVAESIFFDGAEGDGSQWTITGMLFLNPNLEGTTGQTETPLPNPGDPAAPNPDGVKWAVSADEARSGAGAWYSEYPDMYRTRMVSVAFEVPAGGATLTYALMGGAEDTAVEGLFVLAGPAGGAGTVAAEHRGALPGWTQFSVPLAAGPTQIEFRFDSDLSCSNYTDAPPGFGCGAGYDAGGFYLDDITVA